MSNRVKNYIDAVIFKKSLHVQTYFNCKNIIPQFFLKMNFDTFQTPPVLYAYVHATPFLKYLFLSENFN